MSRAPSPETEAVCRLHEEGYQPREIAARLPDLSDASVRRRLADARKSGRLPQWLPRDRRVTMALPWETANGLVAAAGSRALLPGRLATLLLLHVLRDDLIAAVLGEERSWRTVLLCGSQVTCSMQPEHHERLVGAAQVAGVRPTRLAAGLLAIILRDGLVPSILDNEEEVS